MYSTLAVGKYVRAWQQGVGFHLFSDAGGCWFCACSLASPLSGSEGGEL
jgi:hypothetical protein